MEQLAQATVQGLGQGALYVLLGLGFVIVYKGTRVVNFAQPALMILGAYVTSTLAVDPRAPVPDRRGCGDRRGRARRRCGRARGDAPDGR